MCILSVFTIIDIDVLVIVLTYIYLESNTCVINYKTKKVDDPHVVFGTYHIYLFKK